MLFFKKNNQAQNNQDTLIETDTLNLKELFVHYDNEDLNIKLTNLIQDNWHLKKSIKTIDGEMITELEALSSTFNISKTSSNMDEHHLESETLSLEAIGLNDEFYCLEIGLTINDVKTTIFENTNKETVGLKINISGNVFNGITDLNE